MNIKDSTTPKSALDQIEREIVQIDQLVKSWSSGRTLRFDPAHVQKPPENSTKPPVPNTPVHRVNRIGFYCLNVAAFAVPLVLVAIRMSGQALQPAIENTILIVSLMTLAGANLVLAARDNAKSNPRETSANKRALSNSRSNSTQRSNR